jgi:hypothetical protein
MRMLRLFFAVIAAIGLSMAAGARFDFDPAILIFAILGVGIYLVGRIGGPPLPVDNPNRDEHLIRDGAPEDVYEGPSGGIYFGGADLPPRAPSRNPWEDENGQLR